MDTLTSDLVQGAAGMPPEQTVGWWCLFDAGEAWEWGRVRLANLYVPHTCIAARVPTQRLQQAANQVETCGAQ